MSSGMPPLGGGIGASARAPASFADASALDASAAALASDAAAPVPCAPSSGGGGPLRDVRSVRSV